jgi:S-adenosylmethionine:tRNA ribosyltransferase-isomerase
MLNPKDYSFDLPKHLIAQSPLKVRTDSKLLFYSNDKINDSIFHDLPDILDPNTVLVFNDTLVRNSRYVFDYNGSLSEIFFIKSTDINVYEVFLRKSSKFKIGSSYSTPDFDFEVLSKSGNISLIKVVCNDISQVLEEKGLVPLPPYIKVENPNEFKQRYQTVYANKGESVAAPTAGLHFNKQLLDQLLHLGVEFAFVNLTVGLGTFAPLTDENINTSKLHSESYEITQINTDILNQAKLDGKKIISVGTTTLRCLQSCFDFNIQKFVAQKSSTDIFLYPPFNNFVVDGLITNFHLPESSLFMLICAFVGTDNAKKIYNHAIKHDYRFYSFGDACLFLR